MSNSVPLSSVAVKLAKSVLDANTVCNKGLEWALRAADAASYMAGPANRHSSEGRTVLKNIIIDMCSMEEQSVVGPVQFHRVCFAGLGLAACLRFLCYTDRQSRTQ